MVPNFYTINSDGTQYVINHKTYLVLYALADFGEMKEPFTFDVLVKRTGHDSERPTFEVCRITELPNGGGNRIMACSKHNDALGFEVDKNAFTYYEDPAIEDYSPLPKDKDPLP